ncbi:DsrE family protein [Flectobacillus rivi]|uniref:DsrE family protein n=1 Tax=Flectobacillus rivi TaxID=2984209 RepID=A0ABT6YYT5_9BACT|nr:DsrE family protein [Flectobacillus rivi]MDI9874036.1 DsrE family protein [Flectobacillus rivi]
MKKILFWALAFWCIASLPSFSQKTKKMNEHAIVFHLATPDTAAYRALTKQLNNVLEVWPTAKLEVVVHNKGIGFMKKEGNVLTSQIEALTQKGVVFAVCENTMKSQKITKDQILTVAQYVPVALIELALKQEEGWSYIKAGF